MCDLQRIEEENQNVLFYIHQCVNTKVYDKISEATSSKKTWDMFEKYYGGDAKVKKSWLQLLERHYEMLEMKEIEFVADYISRLLALKTQMKNSDEILSEQVMIKKVLRILTSQHDMIVVTIERQQI